MNEDLFYQLYYLLYVEEKLRGHPGYPNLKRVVSEGLKTLECEAGYPVISEPTAAPIFPADSGVIETDTTHVTPTSDRRI